MKNLRQSIDFESWALNQEIEFGVPGTPKCTLIGLCRNIRKSDIEIEDTSSRPNSRKRAILVKNAQFRSKK